MAEAAESLAQNTPSGTEKLAMNEVNRAAPIMVRLRDQAASSPCPTTRSGWLGAAYNRIKLIRKCLVRRQMKLTQAPVHQSIIQLRLTGYLDGLALCWHTEKKASRQSSASGRPVVLHAISASRSLACAAPRWRPDQRRSAFLTSPFRRKWIGGRAWLMARSTPSPRSINSANRRRRVT